MSANTWLSTMVRRPIATKSIVHPLLKIVKAGVSHTISMVSYQLQHWPIHKGKDRNDNTQSTLQTKLWISEQKIANIFVNTTAWACYWWCCLSNLPWLTNATCLPDLLIRSKHREIRVNQKKMQQTRGKHGEKRINQKKDARHKHRKIAKTALTSQFVPLYSSL